MSDLKKGDYVKYIGHTKSCRFPECTGNVFDGLGGEIGVVEDIVGPMSPAVRFKDGVYYMVPDHLEVTKTQAPPPVPGPFVELFEWQKVGEIPWDPEIRATVGPVDPKIRQPLILWKISNQNRPMGFYAIGMTKETAIVTTSRSWRLLQALLETDEDHFFARTR
jgi:hypothetical protein